MNLVKGQDYRNFMKVIKPNLLNGFSDVRGIWLHILSIIIATLYVITIGLTIKIFDLLSDVNMLLTITCAFSFIAIATMLLHVYIKWFNRFLFSRYNE
ncbi:hypothetical protein K4S75_11365 [Staphylococcus epidermidis]|uniref:Uncharacterized protein n=1 Tax=Staphylococcus warneri TaxID=1292 RepID=A0A8B2ZH24_STAWA|nr:hypothetical protein [Staphylococcus warneri]MCG1060645.1 hypothetical protein [Staphylococcus epidermidis]RGM28328.1 hypothetical protein DXC19_11635 [Staphylococcus warneri]